MIKSTLFLLIVLFASRQGFAQEKEVPKSLRGFFQPGMNLGITTADNSDRVSIKIYSDEWFSIAMDAKTMALPELVAKYKKVETQLNDFKQKELHSRETSQSKVPPGKKYGEPVINISRHSKETFYRVASVGDDYLLLSFGRSPSKQRVIAIASISTIDWFEDLSWNVSVPLVDDVVENTTAKKSNANPSPLRDRLAAVFETESTQGFSGVILAEAGGKVAFLVSKGKRNASDDSLITEETLFEIASVTKPLTAMAVLLLEEQGKLSLDDTIAKYLPNVPDECQQITIRHLIQHTSGLPGNNLGPATNDLGESVALFLKGGPRSKPGTNFEYWNQGYALLSAIIAKVHGSTYEEAMKELVFKPAGMTSACFTGESESTNNVAVGESVRGPSRSALEPPYSETYNLNYQGMGGIVCSAQDLYKLILALRSNKLLTMERTKDMLQPGHGKFGQGWFIETLGETHSRVFHSGSVRGFISSLSWYPGDNASLIVLSNRDEPALFNKVETACRTILEAELVGGLFSPEFSDSIAGVYVSGARRVNLSVDGSKINVLFDWGGPKTGGVLKKGKGDTLIWATNTNETIDVFPGKTESGRIRSLKIMNAEYVRKALPSK